MTIPFTIQEWIQHIVRGVGRNFALAMKIWATKLGGGGPAYVRTLH